MYKELVPDKQEDVSLLVNNLSSKLANPSADNLLLPVVKDERSVSCGKSSASVVGVVKLLVKDASPPPLRFPLDRCPELIFCSSLDAFIPLDEFPCGITARISAIFCLKVEIS